MWNLLKISITQMKVLTFGCWLSLQKSSIVDVQLGCKDASQVEDKYTRATSLMLFWSLYCWLKIFPTWFSCIFLIFHTYFTYWCFIVDSIQINAFWQAFQKSEYINWRCNALLKFLSRKRFYIENVFPK